MASADAVAVHVFITCALPSSLMLPSQVEAGLDRDLPYKIRHHDELLTSLRALVSTEHTALAEDLNYQESV